MESASSCRDSCDRTKADPNEMSYSQLKPSMNTTSAPVRQQVLYIMFFILRHRSMGETRHRVCCPDGDSDSVQEIGGKQKRLYALTDVTNAFRGSVSLSGEYAASGVRPAWHL